MRKRLIGLDLLRMLLTVVVFMFHTRLFAGCEYHYGGLNCLASMGSVFMTGFFMLSGFSIGYVMQDEDLNNIGALKKFYIKRLIGIMPLYLLVMTVYHVAWGGFTLKELFC